MKTLHGSALIVISALVAPFRAAAARDAPAGTTVLRCGRLIDGRRAAPLGNALR
jgi:hypothetical protein